MNTCRLYLRGNLLCHVQSALAAPASSRKHVHQSVFLSTAVPKEDEGTRERLEPRPYEDIPSPKTFLNLNWKVLKNPAGLVQNMEERVRSLGNIYVEKGIPGMPESVILVDPKGIETVYRAGDKGYPKRFPFPLWIDTREELNIPYGMFLDDNEEWLKQRVPISKYIMMPRKMADYWRPFNDVTVDLVKHIRHFRGKDDVMADTVAIMSKWSLESVSLFVLGKRMGCLEDTIPPDCQEFIDDLHGFVSTSNDLLVGIPFHKVFRTRKWGKLVQSFNGMYSHSMGLIKAKIEEIEKEAMTKDGEGEEEDTDLDFLSYMIHSKKMNFEEIAVNAVDLLCAGVDTTSITLASCLYQLAINQEVQEKLRREVQEVVGEESRVTPEHIQNMHYLRDCIKETQRLYPIAPFNGRILKEDAVVSGYRVPAGVVIITATAVAGRLPDNFPEPDKFKPERWSRDSDAPPSPFASLPFGFGRRMCVGRRVAELEMFIALAHLIKTFNVDFTEDKPIKYVSNLFYVPERKMNLTFHDL